MAFITVIVSLTKTLISLFLLDSQFSRHLGYQKKVQVNASPPDLGKLKHSARITVSCGRLNGKMACNQHFPRELCESVSRCCGKCLSKTTPGRNPEVQNAMERRCGRPGSWGARIQALSAFCAFPFYSAWSSGPCDASTHTHGESFHLVPLPWIWPC